MFISGHFRPLFAVRPPIWLTAETFKLELFSSQATTLTHDRPMASVFSQSAWLGLGRSTQSSACVIHIVFFWR